MAMTAEARQHETYLIERAKAGDEAAFAALHEMHKQRVYKLCLKMADWNYSKAEDFSQEVFLQLFRKISTFRGESAFSTWLYRMAVNVILMQIRKKRIKPISIEEAKAHNTWGGGGGKENNQEANDPYADDSVLVGTIDRMELQKAIDALPPGQRVIFILKDVKGFQHPEIAEMLKCSIGNSKSQLDKARKNVRKFYLRRCNQKAGNGCSSTNISGTTALATAAAH